MTDTLEHKTPGKTTDYWMAALKFYAAGYTADEMRSGAASPVYVQRLAVHAGVTLADAEDYLLRLAAAIGQYTTAGLTPEGAYYLASLDKHLGRPYADFARDCDRALSAA